MIINNINMESFIYKLSLPSVAVYCVLAFLLSFLLSFLLAGVNRSRAALFAAVAVLLFALCLLSGCLCMLRCVANITAFGRGRDRGPVAVFFGRVLAFWLSGWQIIRRCRYVGKYQAVFVSGFSLCVAIIY